MHIFHTAMSSEDFYKLGCVYMKHGICKSKHVGLRRYRSFFGMSPNICFILWNKLKSTLPLESEPKHLLWCLLFLKQYHVEHSRRTILDADEKTIRKWSWIFIKHLADLNMVCSIIIVQ